MNIYFENNKKYIRVDNFAIEYSEAKKIFNQIYPKYIQTFRGFTSQISEGFDSFITDYDGLVEALTTDEISGITILYKLSAHIFFEFEILTKRKRFYKKEHTDKEWQLKLKEYKNRCVYCGWQGDLEKDHFIPISRGGSDKIENIVPSCRKCNVKKSNKIMGS